MSELPGNQPIKKICFFLANLNFLSKIIQVCPISSDQNNSHLGNYGNCKDYDDYLLYYPYPPNSKSNTDKRPMVAKIATALGLVVAIGAAIAALAYLTIPVIAITCGSLLGLAAIGCLLYIFREEFHLVKEPKKLSIIDFDNITDDDYL
ncbi:MAG: hypothetical protein LBI69_04310 [Puniceicoccales bacterium]|jgi:hypothetical protein|nr:hypothetical protein [Puniceicoccales bacterium]